MTALDFAPEELREEGLQLAGVDRTTVGQQRPQQGSAETTEEHERELSPQPTLTSKSDEFGTPDYIFKPLDAEFHFTLDAAASNENSKCSTWITKEMNALRWDWTRTGGAVWVNPPYSRGNVEAFVQKAYEESQKGATVVMLLPARTEQPWFHDIVLPHAEVRFIRKRIQFVGGKQQARQAHFVAIFPKRRPIILTEKDPELRAMLNKIPRIREPRCVA